MYISFTKDPYYVYFLYKYKKTFFVNVIVKLSERGIAWAKNTSLNQRIINVHKLALMRKRQEQEMLKQ